MYSIWCGIQRYCHTVINLEYCPFCLRDQKISASQRLQAWTRNYLLMKHVDKHIKDMSSTKFICPHPLCDEQVDNLVSFQYHLGDTHGLTKLQCKAFGAQRNFDKETSDFMSSTSLDVLSSRTQARKKKKSNDGTESTFVAWTPSLYLNSIKRRKLVQDVKLDATFIEKPCTAPLIVSDSLSGAQMGLRSDDGNLCDNLSEPCLELSPKNSCLTFSSEKNQNMKALVPKTRWGQDEIFIKSATDPNLHESFVFCIASDMSNILIDSVLLFLNEFFVSNVFTHAFEENNTGEKINASLFTELITSFDENNFINLIVVTDDQL